MVKSKIGIWIGLGIFVILLVGGGIIILLSFQTTLYFAEIYTTPAIADCKDLILLQNCQDLTDIFVDVDSSILDLSKGIDINFNKSQVTNIEYSVIKDSYGSPRCFDNAGVYQVKDCQIKVFYKR